MHLPFLPGIENVFFCRPLPLSLRRKAEMGGMPAFSKRACFALFFTLKSKRAGALLRESYPLKLIIFKLREWKENCS